MLCGSRGICKVYWELSTRCCEDCLIQHTVAEYCLKQDYGLDPAIFQHLPSHQVDMHARHEVTFTVTTYWKADLLPVLQQEHNVGSFEEMAVQHEAAKKVERAAKACESARISRIRRNKAAEHNTQAAERSQQLQNWCQQDSIDLHTAGFSRSYRDKLNIATRLDCETYDTLLPVIKHEIDAYQQQALADKVAMEHNRSGHQQARSRNSTKPAKPARPGALTCSVCGGSFTPNGLRDHSMAKHSD